MTATLGGVSDGLTARFPRRPGLRDRRTRRFGDAAPEPGGGGWLGLFDGGWEGSRTLADPELQALFHGELRQAADAIIQLMGSTAWAIGLATAEILEAVLRSKVQMQTVGSHSHGRSHGHYGLPDVCLGLPMLVNDSGAAALVLMALSEKGMGPLRHRAQLLQGMLDGAGF